LNKRNDFKISVRNIMSKNQYKLKNSHKGNHNPFLCTSCHIKTNFNRDKWIIYFKVGVV